MPAEEQPQIVTGSVACHSTSGLQSGSFLRQERSQSIDIPSRPGSSLAAATDSRPASAGVVCHNSQRLSRRSSSGLLQGSPDVRPAPAEDRCYSSSTSPAGDGSKRLLQASTDFRPASAGDSFYSSAVPARHAGSGLLQASLNHSPASGEDRFHAISINSSPPRDADQDAMLSGRHPTSTDEYGMGNHPMHSSSIHLDQSEMGDRQGLLTSLKSHRAESFRHREAAAGLSRKFQQALQACEGARRQVIHSALLPGHESIASLHSRCCLLSSSGANTGAAAAEGKTTCSIRWRIWDAQGTAFDVQAILGEWRTSDADVSADHVMWSAGCGAD